MNARLGKTRSGIWSLIILSGLAWAALAGAAATSEVFSPTARAQDPSAKAVEAADGSQTQTDGQDQTAGPEDSSQTTQDTPSQAGAEEAEDDTPVTPVVGWLELSEALRDGPAPFAWVDAEEAGPSLGDVLNQLDYVAEHDEYLGVVIYLDQPMLRLSQVLAIADKVAQVREAGKRVLIYAEAYDTMEYVLASSADLILLQHKGEVQLLGLSIEEMYLAGLLELVGAKADMVQIGKFKGASESLMRTGPSEEWNQNIDALLDDLYGQIIELITAGRSMTQDEVEGLLGDSWTMTDTDYLRRRVVDRLTDRDLIDVTEVEFGDNFNWDDSMGLGSTSLQINNPMMLFGMLFKEADTRTTRPTIAVVHADGPIHSGDSSHGQGMFDTKSIGSRTMVEVLGDARDDDNIKGVILRINSPGGSALASEIIWQAVRDLGENKPVYVSIGSMAASGGYYIASAGDEIYLTPTSIVGSIGVVGGKIVLGGLYEKIGISVHQRSRGPMSSMFNSVEPFTEDQRLAVRRSMELIYDQFVQRVTIGRGSRLPDIASVAEGRLFTGRQAADNGMADKLGGVAVAMTDLAQELGLADDDYDVIHLPAPMSLQTYLNEVFGAQSPSASSAAPWLQAAKQVLGPRTWPSVSASLKGLMLLQREPVLTLMPAVIVVR